MVVSRRSSEILQSHLACAQAAILRDGDRIAPIGDAGILRPFLRLLSRPPPARPVRRATIR